MKQVGVIGAGEAEEDILVMAEEVGREVAKRGAVLLCGGLGGVMEASARGAEVEGGSTVGILPGESADEANPFLRVKVVTDMGHARNVVISRSADVLVAVGGSLGTLSEIALGLKSGTPVVVLETGSDSGAERAARVLEHEDLFFASSPARAVERALSRVD